MDTTPTFEMVNKGNLDTHVRTLTAHGPRHKSDSKAVTEALTYLKNCLSRYGYTAQEEMYGKNPHEVNLLCELVGTGSAPVLEIAAHWDTVEPSPGADDNASGVAGVLELARVLKIDNDKGLKLGRTVRFCLFGGEEDQPDLCTGSRYHVDHLKTAPDGVIVLEMIAYQDKKGGQTIPPELLALRPDLKTRTKGDFIAAVGMTNAAGYLDALKAAGPTFKLDVERIELPSSLPSHLLANVARSDHSPYWKRA